jgi:1,2-diacylglycerol 3-alpha-glucosyltransferase
MASSLPVLVSSRCGAAEDLVEDGRNGFTFDPNSPQQLARHMQYISSLNCDDRRHMGDASLQIISTYSPLNFGHEVASLLRMAGA